MLHPPLQDLFTLQGFNVARMNFGKPGEFKYGELNTLAGSLARNNEETQDNCTALTGDKNVTVL